MSAYTKIAGTEPAFRIVTRVPGGLLGMEYLVAFGTRYFVVGEPTLQQLNRGSSPEDLGLYEVDPDDEPVPEYPEEDRRCSRADHILKSMKERI